MSSMWSMLPLMQSTMNGRKTKKWEDLGGVSLVSKFACLGAMLVLSLWHWIIRAARLSNSQSYDCELKLVGTRLMVVLVFPVFHVMLYVLQTR